MSNAKIVQFEPPAVHPLMEETLDSIPASSPLTQPDEVERVFNKFDANGDGKISSAELRAVLAALGSPASDEELARAMSELDADGDGHIDLSEFRSFHCGGSDGDEDLKTAFKMYDKDGDGKITASELHAVLLSLGEKCTTGECECMIGAYDVDGDGCISFEEFEKMMKRTVASIID